MSQAYHGGQFFKVIGENFDTLENKDKIISADVLDAWFDPSPKVVKKLSDNLTFAIKTSPPTHCSGLINTIARIRGINEKNVLVGGGSSDIMFYFLPNFFQKEAKIMILDPMYGEYSHILENVMNMTYITYKLSTEHDFVINVNEFIAHINNEQPNAVIMVNPNSPTGKYLDREQMLKILNSINKNITLILDETYIEYAGREFSLEKQIEQYKNLVIIKSMSKVYALSGLRVAYMVAHETIIQKISRFVPPRAVSLPSQIAAIEALNDEDYYQQKYNETHVLRKSMEKELMAVTGCQVFQGTANFILVSIRGIGIQSEVLVAEMQKDNVFVRDCSPWSKSLEHDYIRIAIKDQKSNDLILTSFKNAINRLKAI